MACTCAPALIACRNELNLIAPHRDKESDGCCASSAHSQQNPKSDHEPGKEGAAAGFARAYDYDEDVIQGMGDQQLHAMGTILLADKRTKYLIYEGQLLFPDGTVKKYTGPNKHEHHLHHSIHDSAVHDTSPWGIAAAFPGGNMALTLNQETIDAIAAKVADLLRPIEANSTSTNAAVARLEVAIEDKTSGLVAKVDQLAAKIS
jgi:hypothetical protein